MADPAVSFTDSWVEQALRMVKLPMKTAEYLRTRAGAERFTHVQGLVETARKQGHNFLDLRWQDSFPP